MRITRLLFAGASILALSAPVASAQTRAAATARDEAARLRAAVEASATRSALSFNRGDIAGFVRAYSPDVWLFPPNEQPVQGPDAALDYFKRGYDQGSRNLQLTTTGLDRSGSMAYETGIYTIEYPTPGQSAAMTRDNGKYVHIWKRDPNGEWRIHLATWSSNNPPAAMSR